MESEHFSCLWHCNLLQLLLHLLRFETPLCYLYLRVPCVRIPSALFVFPNLAFFSLSVVDPQFYVTVTISSLLILSALIISAKLW